MHQVCSASRNILLASTRVPTVLNVESRQTFAIPGSAISRRWHEGVGAALTAGCVRQQGIESTSTSYVGGNNAAMGEWVVVRQLTISIRCGQEELRGRRVRYTLALGRSSDSLASMRELFETPVKGNQSSTKRQIDGKQKKFTCSNEPCKKM